MGSVSHGEEFCGDSTPFPIPTMGDQIEGGTADYPAFREGDRSAPEKKGGGDMPDLSRCAGELFLIATVLGCVASHVTVCAELDHVQPILESHP
jgi:hypothetical protein